MCEKRKALVVGAVALLVSLAVLAVCVPGASADEDPFVIIGHVTRNGDPVSGVTVEAVNQRTDDVLSDDTDASGVYIVTLGGPPHPWEIGDTILMRTTGQGCLHGETSFSITRSAVASQPVWANISMQASLEADFSFTPDAPRAGQMVNFTDQSTGTVTNYTWELGDGNRSFVSQPSHVYTEPGNYTVSLTVRCDSVSMSVSHVVAVQSTDGNHSGNNTNGTNGKNTTDDGDDTPGMLLPAAALAIVAALAIFKRRR